MVYNPEKAKEVEPKNVLPKDSILGGAIITVNDGIVENFVTNLDNWRDPKQPAIELIVQIMHEGESVEHKQVMTYNNDGEGNVIYTSGSNLAKFKKKYGSLPKPSLPVKIVTNNKGFGAIKLD